LKKIFTLTLLVFILFLAACQNNPVDPTPVDEKPSAAEVEGIPLIVELRTSSTWSDLKILNTDLILSAEITSLIGDPSYFDLEDSTLAVEQSQEASANGEQVGLIASLILDESAVEDDVDLEFDLTKDCSNQSTISIYGVVEDQPRMIYQRDLGETEDCGGVAFSMGISGRLAAMETIGSANFAREEIVFRETEPPTIMNGLEIEFVTRSELSWMEGIELPSLEVLALVGEIEDFGHGNDMVFDLGQSEEEAQLGKWVGGRVRLEYDLEAEDQILDFTLHRGCTNETILQFFRVVEGERFPIPNLDNTYNTTIFECVDPIQVQVDLNKPQVDLRYFVLEKGHLDEGDQDAEGQIFLEAELSTNSNWAEIRLEDERVISSEMLSVAGDPTRVHVNLDTLKVEQPNSSAGSGLEMGVVARYGFIPGDDPVIPLKLDNGCLNQASIRFFANLDGKIVAIPLEGDQESLTAYGCEARDFTLDLEMVQAIIRAAELYDDLPLVAHLSDITGEVLVRQPGMEEFLQAWEGTPLNVGGELLTGANAEVYLTVSDGAVIRLGPNTIFGLEMGINSEEIIMPRFRLELGEMELASGSDGFLIITPKEVLGAIGSAALVTVSAEGEAEMDCIAGDCFQYDGTDATEGVKDDLPDVVAVVLDLVGAQFDLTGKPTDSDSDGVPDELDLCPEEGDHGFGLDSRGCPINNPSEDSDGDGILNGEDECPNLAAEVTRLDQDGCPIYQDTDGDGIENSQDLCPTKGDKGYGLNNDGCPYSIPDWDGDGYPDAMDACPTVYAPSFGSPMAWYDPAAPPNFWGCPYNDWDHNGIPDDAECEGDDCPPDRDGDGFLDDEDACPDYFGTRVSMDAMNLSGIGEIWYSNGCPVGDWDRNGIPDDVECEGCVPPGYYDECPDWDGDGICASEDICPDIAGIAEFNGCPSLDSDNDRIFDVSDDCPSLGDLGLGLLENGCPIMDTDRDGISDDQDWCIKLGDLGFGLNPFGCPLPDYESDDPLYPDHDSDGFIDFVDRCPNVYASTYWGFEYQGCPVGDFDLNGISDGDECTGEDCNQDWDGDGVPNVSDYCPTTWGTSLPSTAAIMGSIIDLWSEGPPSGCPYGDQDFDGVPDSNECSIEIECTNHDGDYLPDDTDMCPAVWSPYNSGCPVGDNNFNGIPDDSECTDCEPLDLSGNRTFDCTDEYCDLDSDGDGVNDYLDFCPTVGTDDFGLGINNIGCPIEPIDFDKDGIPDIEDRCPTLGAMTFGTVIDDSGCPTPPTDIEPECIDEDNDSVCLIDDLCPYVAGSLINQGCKEGDSDGDGVRDGADLCSGVVDPLRGVTPLGCPRVFRVRIDDKNTEGAIADTPVTGDTIRVYGPTLQLEQAADKDNDGFADDHDQCPNQGDQGYGLGRDGCPLPAPADSDGDGIVDTKDTCPKLGDQGAGLRDNGCPVSVKATTDPDGDGIVGSLDKCPEQGGDVGLDGCPKQAGDSDGDGVPDDRDSCPNQGNLGYGISRDGCPLKPPDTDGDGVADNQDRCPNKGDQGYGLSSDGCPVGAPDSDGDGVNDSLDKCPDKGDAGFGVDRAGCPLSNPNPPTAIPAKDSDGDGINDSMDKCPNEGDAGYGINARGCPNPAPEPTAAPVEPTAAPPPPPPKPTEAPPEPTSEPN